MAVYEKGSLIFLENEHIRFCVGTDGKAVSLTVKATGQEMLADSDTPLFTVTQDRFFHNELKLMYSARKITVVSDSISYENGCLIAGFSPLPYKAVIEVKDMGDYFLFSLSDFNASIEEYGGILIALPPAVELRFLQLHLRETKYFGEWMNVCHDDETALAVMGTSPYAVISNEKTRQGRILFADAKKGLRFKGCSAVLVVGKKSELLDKVSRFEYDFKLPRGVESRRSDKINASAYWVYDATPENIDEHIKYAVQGGFTMMLMYYTCFVKEKGGYLLCGNYDLRDEYKNGLSDIGKMLHKIKEHGITPGFHFLHSHIGLESRYFSPSADHRVMLRQALTLARDISEYDTEIVVDQYPFETELHDSCRLLRFGTEIIHYESCTDTPAYTYKGCIRGYGNTTAQPHSVGTGGGVVYVSEFGGTSGYCDQNSSLQDEIAEKIAAIYNQGFRFIYMDGSEGVNAPYEYQIPMGQLRVYEKFNEPPLYCEAAAKAHFSWHILSGGNAFDIFPTDIFKSMIDKYPLSEVSEMQMDFTRLNFGWWGIFPDSRPDVFEYGTSHAVGCDCPVTIQSNLENLKNNHRTKDNLEVLRRWEDVRLKKLLTQEQKEKIREKGREFILLLNGKGEYELTEYFPVKTNVDEITVYRFERNKKNICVLCHNTGEADVLIPLKGCVLRDEVDGECRILRKKENGTVIHISDRCYLETSLSVSELTEVFQYIEII